ncbi:MAG: hypothetical protein FWB73_00230 [Treponema sp.]|nr:hypothetical protein [Treponema sp.]
MSATYKLEETPQSCRECELHVQTKYRDLHGYNRHECIKLKRDIREYETTRHPDCPLKITEDNLRWQGNGTETIGYYITCPICKKEPHGNWDKEELSDDDFPNFCPHCGIKLLPPENKE